MAMAGASYQYLLSAFQDPKERAELLDLGHRLGLEPDAPEWAQLALGEFNARRISAAADHLVAATQELIAALNRDARSVANELAQKAEEVGAHVRTGAAEATREALEAALPTFTACAKDSLREAVADASNGLNGARKTHLEAAARLERVGGRIALQRLAAVALVALTLGAGGSWWFTASTLAGAVHAEVCADLGRRTVQIADYLRSKGFATAADAVASGGKARGFGDCR